MTSDDVPPAWNGLAVPIEASIDDLSLMLTAPPPDCWRAFEALGRHPTARALALLIDQTTSSDPYRRAKAIQSIGSHHLGQSAVGDVRRLLGDSNQFVLRGALGAAAVLKDDRLHDDVLRVALTADLRSRLHAMDAVAALWRRDDFAELFRWAATDPDIEVRRKASFVLNWCAKDEATTWRDLAGLWLNSDLPRERVWVCELLGRHGGREDLQLLSKLLSDIDGHVRHAATRAVAAVTARNNTK
jgi:HEAT repeat protein